MANSADLDQLASSDIIMSRADNPVKNGRNFPREIPNRSPNINAHIKFGENPFRFTQNNVGKSPQYQCTY